MKILAVFAKICILQESGGRLNIDMSSYPHVKEKTALRPSYL